MSEHLSEERKQLYRELGLEELIDDYPAPSDHDVSVATEVQWATQNSDYFVQFFKMMEKDPESGNLYEGYVLLANSLVKNLQTVLTSKEPKWVTLGVKPGRYAPTGAGQGVEEGKKTRRMALEQDKLYEGEERTASRAFRMLAYKMAKARTAFVNLDDETGYGQVVMEGESDGNEIYFVEQYGGDEIGRYMSWTAMNYPPVARQSKEVKIYTTIAELPQDPEITELEDIATTEVDELQIVRDYLDHRRAA